MRLVAIVDDFQRWERLSMLGSSHCPCIWKFSLVLARQQRNHRSENGEFWTRGRRILTA
jgi:hypothetical protein